LPDDVILCLLNENWSKEKVINAYTDLTDKFLEAAGINPSKEALKISTKKFGYIVYYYYYYYYYYFRDNTKTSTFICGTCSLEYPLKECFKFFFFNIYFFLILNK
jgi:hypothetical protein